MAADEHGADCPGCGARIDRFWASPDERPLLASNWCDDCERVVRWKDSQSGWAFV